MPKTGPNIYKRKDGRWEGRYIQERVNGRAKYGSVYAPSYREVKCKLDTARQEAKKRKLPIIKAGTLSEVSRCWITDIAPDLKESSIVKYEDMLRCHIIPEFGDMELSDITNDQLIRFVSKLRTVSESGKARLATSTVSEILTTMNALRIYALKKDCTVVFSTDCITLKRDKPEPRVLSIEEERRLIAYLRNNMDLTALGVLVCLYTGIRVGELCALRWDEICLSERTMRIGRTMQRLRTTGKDAKTEVKILEPKSAHSTRTIPLPDVLMELLPRYYVKGAYLLTGEAERYVEPRTMQRRFKRILKNCGIADANFHTTRHTFATRCVELGFDVKSLSEILGHSSVSMTMTRYVHPTMAHKAENMNKLSKLF